MAITLGFTAVTGSVFTAAQYNTNVRDSLSGIWVATTNGDLIYATSGTAAARLGIGAAASIIQSNGSVPSWLAPGTAKVLYNNGSVLSWETLISLFAGLPIVTSQAAGDTFYASGASGISRLAKGSALNYLRMNSGATAPEWANVPIFYPLTTKLTNASWNGDNKTTGTTTITANSFNASIPTDATALLITISASWPETYGGNVLNLAPDGSTDNCLLVRSQVGGNFQDNMGIVPLNAGKFDAIIAADTTVGVYIDVWGYFK